MELKSLQSSPSAFRSALRIDADGSPTCLGDVLDLFQLRDFQALDPGWQMVAGQDVDSPVYQRAWLERPRGHSKSSDIAAMVSWALFASRRKIAGVAAAASKEQARILRNAVDSVVRLNPWISRILKVDNYRVRNIHTGSTLDILSSDDSTSYGLLVDFVVCDELTHWSNDGLWTSLFSASAKRQNCLLCIITNAGFGQTWQWDLRESIRQDSSWYFSRLNGPTASWITAERLAEQRRLLPSIAYRRLWLNQWTSGSGDALTEADIAAAMTLPGPTSVPEKGWAYAAGLDLGLSRDKAALVLVGKHLGYVEETPLPRRRLSPVQEALIAAGELDVPEREFEETYVPATNRLKLAFVQVWSPSDYGGKVKIEDIETTITDIDRRFPGLQIGCDPWQAAYLIERLQKAGVAVQGVDFTGPNLKSMCSATLEAFTERNLTLYEHADLKTDLENLRVEEKSYGCRLVSPRGPNGHGDAATALAIALHISSKSLLACNFIDANLIVA